MKLLLRGGDRLRSALRRFTLLQRFAVTSLAVFVLIGLGTAQQVGSAMQSSALKAAESAAFDSLQGPLVNHLHPWELHRAMSGWRLAQFDRLVRSDVLTHRIVVVKVWNPQGQVVYSTDRSIVGKRFPIEDDVAQALAGHDFANVSNLSAEENQADRRFGQLMQVYIPIRFGNGPVVGAFEIYETYGPLAAQIADLQHITYLVIGGGLLLLYLLLFGIVRAGSRTIIRQQGQLQAEQARLEASYSETIMSLAAAVDARDSQTESHSKRVTALATRLAEHIGIDEESLRGLRDGAELHDIGKIGVPDAVLRKPGPLTEQEWELMRRHPVIGYEMIKNISFLQDALPVIRHHHERWDGEGYPDRLSGEDIPLAARIFALADAFDAMTSDRPYRRGLSTQEALLRITADAGSHFDPLLAFAFVLMMSREHTETVSPPLSSAA